MQTEAGHTPCRCVAACYRTDVTTLWRTTRCKITRPSVWVGSSTPAIATSVVEGLLLPAHCLASKRATPFGRRMSVVHSCGLSPDIGCQDVPYPLKACQIRGLRSETSFPSDMPHLSSFVTNVLNHVTLNTRAPCPIGWRHLKFQPVCRL